MVCSAPRKYATHFPYTTLFRSHPHARGRGAEPPHATAVGGGRHRRRGPGRPGGAGSARALDPHRDRKSTRLNSSHLVISYAVFCLKKKQYNGLITRSLTGE